MSRDGVLLLGSYGFIGKALAERLKRENVAVHIVGRNDCDLLETAIPGCGTVIHLASATTPGSSARHPNLEFGNLWTKLSERTGVHLAVAKAVLDIGWIQVAGWKPKIALEEGLWRTWEWLWRRP